MDKLIREIFNIKIRNWTLTLSILICIVLSNFYFATIDFDTLTNFKDRTIGQNMLLGVNGGARTTTYLVIVILFSICFVFLTVIFSFLFKKYEKFYSPEICASEKNTILTFSITAILTFLLKIYFYFLFKFLKKLTKCTSFKSGIAFVLRYLDLNKCTRNLIEF